MNNIFHRLAILLFAFAPLIANAQPLWGGTEFGMSLDQVKAVAPNAVAPTAPGNLADGARELLRLEGVEIVKHRFDASFFFIAEKLTQVTLTLEKGHSFDSAALVFNSVAEALRAKYGAEIDRENARGVLNKALATWISGRTNISVLAMSVGRAEAILNINYQVRVTRDADKL